MKERDGGMMIDDYNPNLINEVLVWCKWYDRTSVSLNCFGTNRKQVWYQLIMNLDKPII